MHLTTDSKMYQYKYNNMYIIKTVADFIVTSQIFLSLHRVCMPHLSSL